MERIKLKSISKSSFRSKYEFPKEQKFFGIIRKLLIEIGLNQANWIGAYYDEKKDDYEDGKDDDISEYIERIDNISNKDYSVDIVYFSNSIEVIFNSKKDKQQQISEMFEKYLED
jgi:hypothetical protein